MGKPSVSRSKTRGRIRLLCGLAVFSFTGLQFWPGANKSNPPVVAGQTVEERLLVPPAVSRMLHRSCGNCHSNQTSWPWYSRVAPFSWQVAKDVAGARGVMNFSDWSSGPGSDANLETAWLALMCSDVQARRMPPGRYLLLHPEARLSAEQVTAFCHWTRAEISRLTGQSPSPVAVNAVVASDQNR